MRLEDLEVYQVAMGIREGVWDLVNGREYFAKDTVGKQMVKAADSIAANLSEGFGRFHYKENKQFCYYSRGSLQEAKTWLRKSNNRGLINDEEYQSLSNELDTLSVKLNNYIRSIGKKP